MKLFITSRSVLKSISVAFSLVFILLTFSSCSEKTDVLPKLNTIQVTDADITSTSAILKGEIQTLGNMNIVEYGIELSKTMTFTTPVNKGFTTSAATGVFQVEFTLLDPNTTYYYKAYAVVNTAHIYSDNKLHFTTKAAGK
jgi:phosphodiesterase/alkaline phosphatase D-like protein